MQMAMQDDPGEPSTTKLGTAQAKSRDDRLKAALKANMARRKVQAKMRAKVQTHNDQEDE
jgi:hypothetical protein